MSSEQSKQSRLRRQIKGLTIFFMIGIAVSGITAFPIQTELEWLTAHPGLIPDWGKDWIFKVLQVVTNVNASYPFISCGTDWLAFAHIIIALLFVGLLKDPVKNRWIVEWAMICCILVFPLAFIFGSIRGIPFFHQLIDCSFGVLGLIPLSFLRNRILRLEKLK